jgi:glycolate oxidase FAD binding subunit
VAREELGGERVDDADRFWTEVREQRLDFFTGAAEMWRASLPSTTAPLAGGWSTLIEWGGALRWLRGPLDGATLRRQLAPLKGHATLYRAAHKSTAPFSALPQPLLALHQRLKSAFDPAGIFNRGRLHPDL